VNKIERISFLGLGVMGFPMAGHLAEKSGAAVTVYNRTGAKADEWLKKYKGQKASTPAKAAENADLIILCVGNDNDLRGVLTGPDSVAASVKAGTIIIDHTTVSAGIAREMYDVFKAKGCAFLDAPVSGGQAGAEKGQLTVMTGGDQNAFTHIEPIIRMSYAKEMRLMGPAGAGQLTKMINQICIAGTLQGLSEGLAFGMNAGLDIEQVLAVIGKGAAQSWQMDNRGATMAKDSFNFGFAVDWMIKDLGIAVEEAKKNGSSLEMTSQILEYYQELQGKGCGRMDTSSLIKRLRGL